MSSSIKAPAQLTFTGIDGYQRTISGIITKVDEGEPHKDGQLKCRFILESSLRLLSLRTDNRIILGHTHYPTSCATPVNNTKFDLSQTGNKLKEQLEIFKFDNERLGVYCVEEHIDNPLGIGYAIN